VETPEGTGILQNIYVTELGYVMGKVYFPSKGLWINYTLSNINDVLKLKSGVEMKDSV
jgi:hypothetical protein